MVRSTQKQPLWVRIGAGLAITGSALAGAKAAEAWNGMTFEEQENAKTAALIAKDYFEDSIGRLEYVKGPSNPAHPASTPLKVLTYNIHSASLGFDPLVAELKRMDADILILQEAPEWAARRLADRLDLHAVMGANHKAILSRHPITGAEQLNYDFSHVERVRKALEMRKPFSWTNPLDNGMGEPLMVRGILHATIDTGSGTVEVANIHQSTSQAWQPRQVVENMDFADGLAGQRVIAGGDTNLNLNAHNVFGGKLEDGWTVGTKVVVANTGASTAQEIADGATFLRGRGVRMDGLFASNGLEIQKTIVNQDIPTSDHQPVLGEVVFK